MHSLSVKNGFYVEFCYPACKHGTWTLFSAPVYICLSVFFLWSILFSKIVSKELRAIVRLFFNFECVIPQQWYTNARVRYVYLYQAHGELLQQTECKMRLLIGPVCIVAANWGWDAIAAVASTAWAGDERAVHALVSAANRASYADWQHAKICRANAERL